MKFDKSMAVKVVMLVLVAATFYLYGPAFGMAALFVGSQIIGQQQSSGPMVDDWKRVEHFEGDQLTTFQQMVKEKSNGHLLVVDFYATWCPPCRALAPHLADLSAKYTSVNFVGINADHAPSIRSHYNVTCFPTLLFIENNSESEPPMQGANVARLNQIVQKKA